VQPGDILFARRGAQATGYSALVQEQHAGWVCGTGAILLRVTSDAIDPAFLSFVLADEASIVWLKTRAVGAVMPNLNAEIISRFPVVLPSVKEQRAIARILGALDDKIELNGRMNATLEAMARAHFHARLVDGADHTWPRRPLADVVEVNPRRVLRAGVVAPYLDMGDMPTRSARALRWVYRETGSGARFVNGDTLVARITPCLENGKTAFVDFLPADAVGWGSTEYIVLRSRPPLPPHYAYLLARTDAFRAFAVSHMTGSSGRQRVPVDALYHYEVAVPPAAVAEAYGTAVAPLFAGMKARDEESSTLAVLRDTLLPKLLSGELRLKDAERLAAAAA